MKLRSHEWFLGRDELGFQHRGSLRALGLDMDRYQGQPIIGIANSWSELNSCNASLRVVAEHVKVGVRDAGGIPLEFPTLSLGEELMKPTAMMYRNLMAMEVEENLRAYPIDGVVLLSNCDKTGPAQLMAAASADLPALQLSGGPRVAGSFRGQELGSGTDLWRLWDEVRAGRMSEDEFRDVEKALSCGPGACNVMGTASTMAALAEALGLMLPGTSALGVYDPRRFAAAEATGRRAVELVAENLRPSRILTSGAFDNAIRLLLALGGSTNAVLHLLAIAGRRGLTLGLERFDQLSATVPCLLDVQPSGRHLVSAFDAAGGVPALMKAIEPLLDRDALTVTGHTWGQILREVVAPRADHGEVVRTLERPLSPAPTLAVLHGNLAPKGAIVKVSAARSTLLQHTGAAIVFESYADMLARIDDPALPATPDTVLVLRHAGPKGGPGMPEWGALPIPKKLQREGVTDMVRVSDARMSGTAYGTVVLHVAPEAAVGGPIALIRDGDVITLDLAGRRIEAAVSPAEWEARRRGWREAPAPDLRGYPRLYREQVLQADEGCDFEFLKPRSQEALRFVPPTVGRS